MEIMLFILSEKRLDKPFSGVRERKTAVIRRRNEGHEMVSMWLYEYFPISAEISLYNLIGVLREHKSEFWIFGTSDIKYCLGRILDRDDALIFWTEYYGFVAVCGNYYHSSNGTEVSFIYQGVKTENETQNPNFR